MPTPSTKIIHRIGRRGAFLIFLAMLDLIYGYSLAFPTVAATNSPGLLFLASILSLKLWALLWATIGVICFVFAFKRKDAPGYASAMFLKILWAIIFLLGWLFAGIERGYLSTVIWGTFAGILGLIATWPDSSKYPKEAE